MPTKRENTVQVIITQEKKRTRQTTPDNPGSPVSKFIVKYMFLSVVLPGILMVKY